MFSVLPYLIGLLLSYLLTYGAIRFFAYPIEKNFLFAIFSFFALPVGIFFITLWHFLTLLFARLGHSFPPLQRKGGFVLFYLVTVMAFFGFHRWFLYQVKESLRNDLSAFRSLLPDLPHKEREKLVKSLESFLTAYYEKTVGGEEESPLKLEEMRGVFSRLRDRLSQNFPFSVTEAEEWRNILSPFLLQSRTDLPLRKVPQ